MLWHIHACAWNIYAWPFCNEKIGKKSHQKSQTFMRNPNPTASVSTESPTTNMERNVHLHNKFRSASSWLILAQST